jgi:hypothetical protein
LCGGVEVGPEATETVGVVAALGGQGDGGLGDQGSIACPRQLGR